MLLDANESFLLVVDMQEKLMPLIHQSKVLVEYSNWLIDIAKELSVPILCTEQYPKGLGTTIADVKSHLSNVPVVEKVEFSVARSAACLEAVKSFRKKQVVIIGIEAHVCILQTAIDLLSEFEEVYVVADAVSSRSLRDVEFAIARMRDVGVEILTREMVVFEWLDKSGTKQFKTISQKYLK